MNTNEEKTDRSSPGRLIDLAVNRMLSAFTSYYIWRWISQSINVHTKGFKKNLEVINRYDYFFKQILIDSFESFVVNLSIFFDKNYPDTFSIYKLIIAVGSGKREIKQIEEIKKPHHKTIGLLKKLRDEDVVHQALDPRSRPINYESVEKLFSAVQSILATLTHKHNRSSWRWEHIEDGVRRDMEWIFDNLKRGEMQRIKDIEEEYKRKDSQKKNR